MSNIKSQVHSTAGAIPVKNEKGQLTMIKVKVQRYVAGKKPDFASDSSSDSESETTVNRPEEINSFQSKSIFSKNHPASDVEDSEQSKMLDPRFVRLQQAKDNIETALDSDPEDDYDQEAEDRLARHKKLRKAESDQSSDGDDERSGPEDDDEDDQELDETEIVRRRQLIRERALASARRTDELDQGQDEEDDDDAFLSASSSSSDSGSDEEEEQDAVPKLKPVFIRSRDRITLQAKQQSEALEEEKAAEAKRLADQRRKTTLKLVENELRRETEEAHVIDDALDAIDSDEGQGDAQAEQEQYEKWKLRELKRIRRDREARESDLQEKQEIERIRSMTDEERREEFARNPKQITNQSVKGKYKFLQKYYHRGAFFVGSEEDKVFQQDFTQPTLEDHFDKTKMPAVMQVKNFGRAGRTKYTHLVDQDTTVHDSPWATSNPANVKFQSTYGGGFKQIFSAPTASSRRRRSSNRTDKA